MSIGDGKSRDYSEPVRLPHADPWDTRRGIMPVIEFEVVATWTPINDGWAQVTAGIHLHDGYYDLAAPAQMLRHQSGVLANPELFTTAWVKKMLGSAGATVMGLYEQNPGHITHQDGSYQFRWIAGIGSKLTVAVVRLSGNLEGTARLVPVE